MDLPLSATWTGHLRALRSFTIHGDRYDEILLEREGVADIESRIMLRVPQHAWGYVAKIGDRIQVEFLIGQVTKVTPA